MYLEKKPKKINIDPLWKFVKYGSRSHITVPAHQILLPIDTHEVVNFLNYNDLGVSNLEESSAFARVRAYSKRGTFITPLMTKTHLNRLNKLKELYSRDTINHNLYFYEISRQHLLANPLTLLPDSLITIDKSALKE